MADLAKLLSFTQFTHKFQQVIRTIYVTGGDRNENDAEHSFQLALVAWYIAGAEKGSILDTDKLIKYAIAHDLVETYAGDTYFHSTDTALKESKGQREKDALKRIKAEFPEFPELHKMITAYESRQDRESKFIYALDKMLPVLNIYLDEGRSWKRDKVSLSMIRTKDEKIAVSPEITKLWQELVKIVGERERELFE